jgi:ABC-type transport system involved in multi-copper enzyme maturation permease subunit
MNSTFALPTILLGTLLVANVVVSIAIAGAVYYSPQQKIAQILLIWFVPLIGAIGVGVFLYSQRDNEMYDTRAYPEPSEKAIAYTIHESVQGHEHAP